MVKNKLNNNYSRYLLEIYLKNLTFTTVHEVTNATAILSGFIEDLIDEIEEDGEVILNSREQITPLIKGIEKLQMNMNRFRSEHYFTHKKETIFLEHFLDEVINSCRHIFIHSKTQVKKELLTETIECDHPKLFTVCQLIIIHYATKDNEVTISNPDDSKIIFTSDEKQPPEYLTNILSGLDWDDFFEIEIEEQAVYLTLK